MKVYIKTDKKIINFGDTEVEKKPHKFHQNKSPILINNLDTNKIVISNNVSCGKRDFKYFIGCKDTKKIDLYAYSFQKWVHIE